MISGINSSVSAIQAFGQKMDVTANNIANANTDEFQKSRATLQEGQNGAVKVEISKVKEESPVYTQEANNELKLKKASNVDLTQEIPQIAMSQRGYEANLKTFKTQDEMLGTIVNTLG